MELSEEAELKAMADKDELDRRPERWHEGMRAWQESITEYPVDLSKVMLFTGPLCWAYVGAKEVCVLGKGHDGNAHEPTSPQAKAADQERLCLICGRTEPCHLDKAETSGDPNWPGSPCTFDPTPQELYDSGLRDSWRDAMRVVQAQRDEAVAQRKTLEDFLLSEGYHAEGNCGLRDYIHPKGLPQGTRCSKCVDVLASVPQTESQD